MPSPIEINNPNLKYCHKADLHCLCISCDLHTITCYIIPCSRCEILREEKNRNCLQKGIATKECIRYK